MEAVSKHRDTTQPEEYEAPNLRRVLPYLPISDDGAEVASTPVSSISDEEKNEFNPEIYAQKLRRVLRTKNRMKRRTLSTMRVMMDGGGGMCILF